MLEQILLFIIAFIANMFSAFAGGGAGLLQLPALIFLGLNFQLALATHKIASIALGLGATFRHLKERNLSWFHLLIMLAFGIPGVVLGANIILDIPGRSAEIALGLLTIGLGVYSWLKPSLGQQLKYRHHDFNGILIGGLVLFSIGILNGSLTSGTGLFVTLWLIRWFGMDYKVAVAHTLVLVGIAWNGAGAITLAVQTDVQWDWLPALLLGSLLGGYVGAHYSIVKGNRTIKTVYEIITITVGIFLILGREMFILPV